MNDENEKLYKKLISLDGTKVSDAKEPKNNVPGHRNHVASTFSVHFLACSELMLINM